MDTYGTGVLLANLLLLTFETIHENFVLMFKNEYEYGFRCIASLSGESV